MSAKVIHHWDFKQALPVQEYGNEWWEHGHLLEKQNSFDDFASCAQYLQTSNWTSPAKLTIQVAC